jgi:hypothetical protein
LSIHLFLFPDTKIKYCFHEFYQLNPLLIQFDFTVNLEYEKA